MHFFQILNIFGIVSLWGSIKLQPICTFPLRVSHPRKKTTIFIHSIILLSFNEPSFQERSSDAASGGDNGTRGVRRLAKLDSAATASCVAKHVLVRRTGARGQHRGDDGTRTRDGQTQQG